MSLASQEVQGVASQSPMQLPLQARRLERQRRRRQARVLSSVLLALGIAFIGHQLLRPPEPSRMEQMAGKLLPAAQAEPAVNGAAKPAAR